MTYTVLHKIKAHLLKQKQQSVNRDGECMYRGDFTRACSIGCIIPDQEYHPDLEGKLIDAICMGVPSISAILGDDRRILLWTNRLNALKRMQVIHDIVEASHWEVWCDKAIAEFGGLFPDIPEDSP